VLTRAGLAIPLSIPSSCPKPNFTTAPRIAPKAIANTKRRTFLATLLPIPGPYR
jgi:hypothetical protein